MADDTPPQPAYQRQKPIDTFHPRSVSRAAKRQLNFVSPGQHGQPSAVEAESVGGREPLCKQPRLDFSDDTFVDSVPHVATISVEQEPELDVYSLSLQELLFLMDSGSDKVADVDIFKLMEQADRDRYWCNDFDMTTLFGFQSMSEEGRILDRILSTFEDSEEMDCCDKSEEEESLSKRVATVLGNWALMEKVELTKVTSLLSGLKSLPELASLPATARTLVKTPKSGSTELVNVPSGGQYFHFGIKKCLLKLLSNESGGHVKLLANTDGIGIFKSKRSDLWPILCRIISHENLSHIVFPVGFYYGAHKPKRPDFLRSFVDEAKSLIEHELDVNGQHFTVCVHGFVCDAPAKSLSLGIIACNGKGSCTRCHVVGKWSHLSNRVYFDSEEAPPRTHDEFMSQSDENYHHFYSPLTELTTLVFPFSMALDYMHLILLGVARTMVYLWLVGKAPHRLSPPARRSINERGESLKEFSPKEFRRKPRTLDDICWFKATEWRQILLYTGMVIFQKDVPESKFVNFLCLSVATRILLNPLAKDDKNMIDYARKLYKYFISQFRVEYGEDFITHNFHNLPHICDDVEYFGDIQDCSAFAFENYMQFVCALVRKSSDVLIQLANRMEELYQNNLLFNQAAPKYFENPHCSSPHIDGPLIPSIDGLQFERLQLKFFELTTAKPDNCCTVGDSIILVANICQNRRDSKIYVLGYRFKSIDDYFTTPCKSSLVGVHMVSDLSGTLEGWPADSCHKNYLLPLHHKVWLSVSYI